MGMEIEKSFVVAAPAGAVWDFLTDPHRVARCLPGAAITEKVDDETYAGTITVKVGPVTASYRGKMRFERLDPALREADIAASGQETRGKGGADMRMKSRVSERSPAETEVVVVSDVNVVGILAQFGRGMIQDVSDQLFQRFTVAMRRELETANPVEGGEVPAVLPLPSPTISSPGEVPAVSPLPSPTTATSPTPPSPVVEMSAVSHEVPAVSPAPVEPALDLGSLGAAAAGRAAGRTLRRPGFWIAVVALAVVVCWLLLR